jgi:hypothetical protein
LSERAVALGWLGFGFWAALSIFGFFPGPNVTVDDPGGGNTDDLGSFGNFATSTTTSSKTSVSFVSSSLTTGNCLLSLSDKSAVDVVGDLDVDYATESFCSSCTIPPRVVVWWVDFGVMEWGVICWCCYDRDSGGV